MSSTSESIDQCAHCTPSIAQVWLRTMILATCSRRPSPTASPAEMPKAPPPSPAEMANAPPAAEPSTACTATTPAAPTPADPPDPAGRTADDTESPPICLICQAEMSPGVDMKMLGCGHTYHLACMGQWYTATSNFEERCPLRCALQPAHPSLLAPLLPQVMMMTSRLWTLASCECWRWWLINLAQSADVLVKPVRKLQVAAGFPKVCGSPFGFAPLAGHHRILFHLGIDESSLCNGLLNATPFGTFKIQFRQFISIAHLSIVMCQQQRRWFEALWGKMMRKSDSYA